VSKPDYAIVAICGSIGWILVWGFAAGFAGEIRFLPDTDLAAFEFLLSTAFYYAAPALTLWAFWRLITYRPEDATK
jgi:hypothetical protein